MKHVHHVSCLRNLLRTLIGCKTIEQCPPRHLWPRPVKVPVGLIIFKGTDRRRERTKQPDTVNEPPGSLKWTGADWKTGGHGAGYCGVGKVLESASARSSCSSSSSCSCYLPKEGEGCTRSLEHTIYLRSAGKLRLKCKNISKLSDPKWTVIPICAWPWSLSGCALKLYWAISAVAP